MKIKITKMKPESTSQLELLELVYGQVMGALAYEFTHGNKMMLTEEQIVARLTNENLANIVSYCEIKLENSKEFNLVGLVKAALDKGVKENKFFRIPNPLGGQDRVSYEISLKGMSEAMSLWEQYGKAAQMMLINQN